MKQGSLRPGLSYSRIGEMVLRIKRVDQQVSEILSRRERIELRLQEINQRCEQLQAKLKQALTEDIPRQ